MLTDSLHGSRPSALVGGGGKCSSLSYSQKKEILGDCTPLSFPKEENLKDEHICVCPREGEKKKRRLATLPGPAEREGEGTIPPRLCFPTEGTCAGGEKWFNSRQGRGGRLFLAKETNQSLSRKKKFFRGEENAREHIISLSDHSSCGKGKRRQPYSNLVIAERQVPRSDLKRGEEKSRPKKTNKLQRFTFTKRGRKGGNVTRAPTILSYLRGKGKKWHTTRG